MPANWYGDAHSAKQAVRSNNGHRSLNAVGGVHNRKAPKLGETRAIYGSSDRATLDHGNDPLCRVASHSAEFTNDPQYAGEVYSRNVFRYAAHEEPVTRQFSLSAHSEEPAPPTHNLETIVARAIKAGVSIVEYCARLGIELS